MKLGTGSKRAAAVAAILGLSGGAMGCGSWFPGQHLWDDDDFQRRLTEQDNATKEMPVYMERGSTPGIDDDWNSIFSGTTGMGE